MKMSKMLVVAQLLRCNPSMHPFAHVLLYLNILLQVLKSDKRGKNMFL